MSICRNLIIGSALLLASLTSAHAGGLYTPPWGSKDMRSGIDMVPAPAPIPEHSSWYIRGDIAYGFHDDPDMLEDKIYDLTNEKYDGTVTLGAGLGYYFGPNWRGDITVDYRFASDISADNPYAAGPWAGSKHHLKLSSLVTLANLYYDFNSVTHGGMKDGGTIMSRFSPYLGVGLGFVGHWVDGGLTTGCGCTGVMQDKTSFDVAAAFMAGFSYHLKHNVKLDAGYRFLYMGSADTGQILAGATPQGAIEIENLHAHELRIGLRYDIQ